MAWLGKCNIGCEVGCDPERGRDWGDFAAPVSVVFIASIAAPLDRVRHYFFIILWVTQPSRQIAIHLIDPLCCSEDELYLNSGLLMHETLLGA